MPLNASTGRWLARVAASDSAGAAFQTLAVSLANLARREHTAGHLQAWLDRAARQLHEDGKRLGPALRRTLGER